MTQEMENFIRKLVIDSIVTIDFKSKDKRDLLLATVMWVDTTVNVSLKALKEELSEESFNAICDELKKTIDDIQKDEVTE